MALNRYTKSLMSPAFRLSTTCGRQLVTYRLWESHHCKCITVRICGTISRPNLGIVLGPDLPDEPPRLSRVPAVTVRCQLLCRLPFFAPPDFSGRSKYGAVLENSDPWNPTQVEPMKPSHTVGLALAGRYLICRRGRTLGRYVELHSDLLDAGRALV